MIKRAARFLLLALLSTVCMAQNQYVSQTDDGNTFILKNVSPKVITEMRGDLLDNGQVVGLYSHTFLAEGFVSGTTESMSVDGLTSVSINLQYIKFKDGTTWKAPAPKVTASATSGQTLYLDLANSYCKKNTFTPGSTLHGTWRNATTGCAGFGSRELQSPYVCAKDPNYGYPDLAARTCRPGICCVIQYTALRPTVAADTDCLSTGNGFYTGVQGEQQ